MKNGQLEGGGSCKYMPVIMSFFTEEKGSSLFGKKKTKKEQRKKTLKSFFLVWLGILHVKEPGTFFFQFCKVGRVMIF